MRAPITRSVLTSLTVLLVATTAAPQQPATRGQAGVTEARVPERLVWQAAFAWDQAWITVSGPPGVTSWSVPAGAGLTLATQDLQAWARLSGVDPDGLYRYEIRFAPALDDAGRAELERRRADAGSGLVVGAQTPSLPTASGTFRLAGGRIVGAQGEDPEAGAAAKDLLHYDDVIVTGSLCVGFDCINGESFGFCTSKLKENNLQLCFEDTSTGSFPSNDWTIQINDTTSGGASYFAIWDLDGGVRPFLIEAGAPSASLYVEDHGRVGLGTTVPSTELHIVDGDSPTVRLHQDASFGWTSQVWDVLGNETNFVIRDVTHDSKLPFRVQPNTPTNTLTMRSTGNVGVGTWTPDAPLEVETTGRDAELRLDRTDGGAWSIKAGADNTLTIGQPDGGATLVTLKTTGVLKAAGPVSGLSDRNAKRDFRPVDSDRLLARLSVLDVSEWSFISEGSGVRHVGPTSQDFRAAFGLGDDDTHIVLSDLGGVALAAIQELNRRLEQKDEEIAELQRRIEVLETAVTRTR